MKNLLFVVIFLTSFICGSAQKVYFIYLQSDNYSPFYVKMKDKIYSSATSGYLIISNLVDSTYNFTIGFPSSQTESRFIVATNGKDRGFLIKYFDTGLGLFDLQSLTIINQKKEDAPKNISYRRRNDEFSSLLSRAADDTSLLYAVVKVTGPDIAFQESKPEIESKKEKMEPVLIKDSVFEKISETNMPHNVKSLDTSSAVQPNNQSQAAIVPISNANVNTTKDSFSHVIQQEQTKKVSLDTVSNANLKPSPNAVDLTAQTEQIFKKSQIRKYSESSTSEGFGLVFYDTNEGGQDTIQLLIPNPPIVFKQSTGSETDSNKNVVQVEEIKKDTVVQLPIVVAVKNNTTRSQCKSVATNNDFFKLRKNMASVNTDDAMVVQANKFFRTKCFTTEQIKNLSSLFLTAAGKYKFFDEAYLHVSDQENFLSLEQEIKDDYFLKRFRALIGE